MRKILICGATSAMAMDTARVFAADGDQLFLLGRNSQKLEALKNDLLTRGASKVEYETCDFTVTNKHEALIAGAQAALGEIDTVLIAYGTLGDQKLCEQSFAETEKELQSNLLSVVSLLTIMSNIFEQRGSGTIAVITSVAGDRGRQSNYVYGCAKGALGIFLQGLRNRLYRTGVTVVTIKPGFVDTPMTASIKKGPLFVGSAVAGQAIASAIKKGKDVAYIPWFWRYIMLIIKRIPECVFKRMKL